MIGKKVIYSADDLMFVGIVIDVNDNDFAKVCLGERYADVFIEVPVSTLTIVND